MTSGGQERIIDVGGDGMRLSMGGLGGTPSDMEVEIQRMSGAIGENLIQVANNLSEEGGDVGRLTIHAMELIEKKEMLMWVGDFENITELVVAAYVYPDANSVIPALIANIKSKELIRDWKTWDQETFMTVAIAILGSAQAFDDLNSESPRHALNVAEFNVAFQQDPTNLRIIPLETRTKPK